MIFYFTGTGNSRFTAEKIGKVIGQEARDIAVYMKKKVTPSFTEDGVYVFVCPCYMSAPARAMTEFIEKASFPEDIKAYFVITCAAAGGISPEIGRRLCEQKGFEYMGAYAVVLPQNYILFFKTKDKEENGKIVEAAIPEIDRIAGEIRDQVKTEPPKCKSFEYKITVWVRDVYYDHFMKTKKYKATDKCISCGKCEYICAYDNITMKDGKPSWGSNCTHCMACINRCPVDAIEYGKGTAGKPRYKGPEAR